MISAMRRTSRTSAFLLSFLLMLSSADGFRPMMATVSRRALTYQSNTRSFELSLYRDNEFQTSVQRRRRASSSSVWEDMFPRLREFYEEHGHSNPTKRDDPELHNWVQNKIRSQYRWQVVGGKVDPLFPCGAPRRKLGPEKLKALAEIHFPWNATRTQRNPSPVWEKNFAKLRRFYERFGHADPSPREDPELSEWIRTRVRNAYKWQALGGDPHYPNGRARPKLSEEAMKAFEEMSFDWNPPRRKIVEKSSPVWDRMYPRLKKFYEEHGHSNPSKAEDQDLYKWVQTNLRSIYGWQVKGGNASCPSGRPKERLADDKMAALAELDFQWDVGRAKPHWDVMFERLRAFYDERGHSNPTREEDPKLNKWIDNSVRKRYKWQVKGGNPLYPSGKPRMKLSDDLLKAFDDMDFEWNPPRRKVVLRSSPVWDKMFPRLRAFYEEHGHSSPTIEDDPELNKWVQFNVRNIYGWQIKGGDPNFPSGKPRSVLSDDKLAALAEMDFRWSVTRPSPVWDAMYPRLREYYEIHGHSSPAMDDEPALAKWADVNLRHIYSWQFKGGNPRFPSGKPRQLLGDDKIAALDEIDFQW